MATRTSQVAVDVVATASANVRASQVAVDAVVVPNPQIRTTQVAVDVVYSLVAGAPTGAVQLAQIIETL